MNTEVKLVESVIREMSDSALNKVKNISLGSNFVPLTKKAVREIITAWKRGWPSINGSEAGNAGSWRQRYRVKGKHVSRRQVDLVIDCVRREMYRRAEAKARAEKDK